MSFGLSPKECLDITLETWNEYKENPLSIRHLMICCIFANHLPEIVVAEHSDRDSAKLHSHIDIEAYRKYVFGSCPEMEIIRDLCDFAKHGPSLGRKSVIVDKTEAKKTMVLDLVGVAAGIGSHHEDEKIVVTLKDGTERFADYLIETVAKFWLQTFASDDL
jgi:hypothetical protein